MHEPLWYSVFIMFFGGFDMSRIDFGAKPIMFPQPVLIIGTYDENGVPNAMNAAWGITTDFK